MEGQCLHDPLPTHLFPHSNEHKTLLTDADYAGQHLENVL